MDPGRAGEFFHKYIMDCTEKILQKCVFLKQKQFFCPFPKMDRTKNPIFYGMELSFRVKRV